jgi:chromosome partitioning protein
MEVISFCSLKGGTGKSSLAILNANVIAASGNKVLVIDMDVNNSCSFTYLNSDDPGGTKHIAAALQGSDLKNHVLPSAYPNVDILQSSLYLVDLRTMPANRLKRLMPTIEQTYDYVVLDTSPTYDNLVLAAMEASDLIITPVMLTQFDYNTALFLKGKLQTETAFFDKWHLVYNGYDRRDTPASSAQKDYQQLFETEFGNFVPEDCHIPWSSLVRRYVDRGERIGRGGKYQKLRAAVINLASFIAGKRITIEGVF